MMELLPFRPRPNPRQSACETVSVLAEAMGFRAPERRSRVLASGIPSKEELAAIVALYAAIGDQGVRQALLDVMVVVGTAR